MDEKLVLTVPQAAKVLQISRALAYEMVRSGELPAVKFNKRILIPIAALNRKLSCDNTQAS